MICTKQFVLRVLGKNKAKTTKKKVFLNSMYNINVLKQLYAW